MTTSIHRLFRGDYLALVFSIVLFFLPFFWFTPGSMDLGGDGTRLYFYDPISFLKNVTIHSITPEGSSMVDPTKHAYLVYVGMIALLRALQIPTHFIIAIFNGIKISLGFLSIYFIVKEFVVGDEHSKENSFLVKSSALISGFFYVSLTGSQNTIFFWIKALHSHDQIFLNPLIFLLMMRYLLTYKTRYMVLILLMGLLFSTSFALISAPPFFAFYPIATLFLFMYIRFVRKRKFLLKKIAIGVFLFIGLQAFHLIPSVANMLDIDSVSNVAIKDTEGGGVNIFDSLRSYGLISKQLLLIPGDGHSLWLLPVPLLIILTGFLYQRRKNVTLIITSIFFLITLFLVSANITELGVAFYRRLFYVPGFSMFRHFFGQWVFVYIFFYALLLGQTIVLIFERINFRNVKIITLVLIILLGIGSKNFIDGNLVDGVHGATDGIKTAIEMPEAFRKSLQFIASLPDEGKILMFPLSDNFNHVLYDQVHNSAYIGPSPISILTHKKSFAGEMNFAPYNINTQIQLLAKDKNYEALTQIFSLFNIRYIFHNTDSRAFVENFKEFPFSYIQNTFPSSQSEYKKFIRKLPVREIYHNDIYEIFEFDNRVYRAEVYISDEVITDNLIHTIRDRPISYGSAFIEKSVCMSNQEASVLCNPAYIVPKANITINKTSPAKYEIHIRQEKSDLPYLLVFQNGYDKTWKLYIEQEQLKEKKHIKVNGYANGWIITDSDRHSKLEYTLVLSLDVQKYFWYGLLVTALTLSILLFIVVLYCLHLTNVKNK